MTGHKEFDRLHPVLVESRLPSLGDMLIEPLKIGRLVVLRVNDPRLPKKKRIEGAPRLFLLPYGLELLVALEGYGSEVVVPERLKSISFMRMGINATLSEVLCDTIKSVYREGGLHGYQSS